MFAAWGALVIPAFGQLVDNTTSPNYANGGINKSFEQQVGAGRGNMRTPDSSLYIIKRDPARSIRRGRQIFQRKFTRERGQGPLMGDGRGDIHTNLAIGAGLADSCAACHGRPRGSAGVGGDVTTRPDSRDAPHLFGLGLKEMLADEITQDLRAIRGEAISSAKRRGSSVKRSLRSKGIDYGSITALPDGSVLTSEVVGVDPDLRVRPFFFHGGTISIREFIVGAFKAEMGLEAFDPDLIAASSGGRVLTPSGMFLDGLNDKIETPPVSSASEDGDRDGVYNEIPTSIVDHLEFYLLNYFKAGTNKQTYKTSRGRRIMSHIGCTSCHIPDLQINRDRRVADVETVYDPEKGIFNRLFATATPLFVTWNDGTGHPALKLPKGGPFLVRNIFTDFKRHDLGPGYYERNYHENMQNTFLTTPLWGVGTTAPYGHDGRSIDLYDAIRRHGGEADESRRRFNRLRDDDQQDVIAFLQSLILFPPDDTASNLDPGDRAAQYFPQYGHGSIKLGVLFNNPADPE
jgi:hypothetical protein